jgi:hypothetical protein
MKTVKILAIVLVAYVAVVAIFESLIGTFQPAGDGTLVITTVDAAGAAHDRVVSKLEVDGKLYVAANHWPRAWYARALENPAVEATVDGEKASYQAVPVTGAEHDAVNAQKALGPVFRVLTGFPPRHFLRLDPR